MAGDAAAAARQMKGKCVRFTKSHGIALMLGDDGREYNLFARVARDGIVPAQGRKIDGMLGDQGLRFGWEWEPSKDPTRPRPNITKVWTLGLYEPKSRAYVEERRLSNSRKIAVKGVPGQRVGMNTDDTLMVIKVENGSVAKAAGVQVGWRVLSVNEFTVKTVDELENAARLGHGKPMAFVFDISTVVGSVEARQLTRQQQPAAIEHRQVRPVGGDRDRAPPITWRPVEGAGGDGGWGRPVEGVRDRARPVGGDRDRDRDRDRRPARDDRDRDRGVRSMASIFERAGISHLCKQMEQEGFDETVLPYVTDDQLRGLGWGLANIIRLRIALGQR
eukprot:gene4816-3540_t